MRWEIVVVSSWGRGGGRYRGGRTALGTKTEVCLARLAEVGTAQRDVTDGCKGEARRGTAAGG